MGFFSKLGNIATGGLLGMGKAVKNRDIKGIASGGMLSRPKPKGPWGMDPEALRKFGRDMSGGNPFAEGLDRLRGGLKAFGDWRQQRKAGPLGIGQGPEMDPGVLGDPGAQLKDLNAQAPPPPPPGGGMMTGGNMAPPKPSFGSDIGGGLGSWGGPVQGSPLKPPSQPKLPGGFINNSFSA